MICPEPFYPNPETNLDRFFLRLLAGGTLGFPPIVTGVSLFQGSGPLGVRQAMRLW